jgi:hypothetical protein
VAPPESPANVRRTRPHWLLEGSFIVISVALGFGVAQYSDYRADRQLAARALASLQAEVPWPTHAGHWSPVARSLWSVVRVRSPCP